MRRVVRSAQRPTSLLRTPLATPTMRMVPSKKAAHGCMPLAGPSRRPARLPAVLPPAASVTSTSRCIPMRSLPRRISTCSGSSARGALRWRRALHGCITRSRFAFPITPRPADLRRAQSYANISQPIELAFCCLAMSAARWRKVVSVNRGRTGGDRTCRALSAVVLVAGDAVLRCHRWRDHFQQIELRRHLEQRAGVLGRPMHLPHVAGHHAYLNPPRRPPADFTLSRRVCSGTNSSSPMP